MSEKHEIQVRFLSLAPVACTIHIFPAQKIYMAVSPELLARVENIIAENAFSTTNAVKTRYLQRALRAWFSLEYRLLFEGDGRVKASALTLVTRYLRGSHGVEAEKKPFHPLVEQLYDLMFTHPSAVQFANHEYHRGPLTLEDELLPDNIPDRSGDVDRIQTYILRKYGPDFWDMLIGFYSQEADQTLTWNDQVADELDLTEDQNKQAAEALLIDELLGKLSGKQYIADKEIEDIITNIFFSQGRQEVLIAQRRAVEAAKNQVEELELPVDAKTNTVIDSISAWPEYSYQIKN